MAERKTDVYRLVMEVTTNEADPAKWNWEEILDLGASESVRIVDSYRVETKCPKCGGVLCSCPRATWRVITYDLWSDGEGGMTVNDARESGKVMLGEDDTEAEVMTKICDLIGGDSTRIGYDHNSEGGDDTIYVLDENGHPFCELRRMSEGK